MAVVGQHTPRPLTGPVNAAQSVDANIVRSNDNILRNALAAHDGDVTIHVQSSDLTARPAAGVVGRLWVTNNAGTYEFWYDDGATWNKVT